MKYGDYLLRTLKSNCPFCDVDENFVIDKSKTFSVILARAPYVKDHLLIIPDRHIVRLGEISADEWTDLVKLVKKWVKNIEEFHDEVNLLLRDGVADGIIGKSINHLHFHLVPDVPFYYGKAGWRERKIFSDFEYLKLTREFKDHCGLK